ncbi:MAG: site-specific integrase [Clostridia bacterium]|nr:site-specific integrase [Clostridia bacterium]
MTGSIQTKNGKYYAVINLIDNNGKRKQKWISTGLVIKGNKKKAEQFLREKIKEFELQKNIVSVDMLFTDYIVLWLDTIKISVDEITYKGYKWMCYAHILPYFTSKKIKLCDISRNHIQDYINYKFENGRLDNKGGLSPKTLKEHKLIINSVLKEAVKNDLISKNPCEFVKLPSIQHREPTFYTKQQVSELLTSIENEELYPLIYLTIIFGLRRSEVLGLKWDSVDFDRKFITIKHTVVNYRGTVEKDTTKNKTSRRTYPMNDYVEKMLLDIKRKENENRCLFGKEYINNDYIFKWNNGKPFSPDYITAKFSKLLKENNLPHIRFHDLRHTCASLLIDNNYQLKDIQEWLGHADIQTTANIYGHIDIERKKNISNSMVDMFV